MPHPRTLTQNLIQTVQHDTIRYEALQYSASMLHAIHRIALNCNTVLEKLGAWVISCTLLCGLQWESSKRELQFCWWMLYQNITQNLFSTTSSASFLKNENLLSNFLFFFSITKTTSFLQTMSMRKRHPLYRIPKTTHAKSGSSLFKVSLTSTYKLSPVVPIRY